MLLVPIDGAEESDDSISYRRKNTVTAGREIVDDALHVSGVRLAAERFARTVVEVVDMGSQVGDKLSTTNFLALLCLTQLNRVMSHYIFCSCGIFCFLLVYMDLFLL